MHFDKWGRNRKKRDWQLRDLYSETLRIINRGVANIQKTPQFEQDVYYYLVGTYSDHLPEVVYLSKLKTRPCFMQKKSIMYCIHCEIMFIRFASCLGTQISIKAHTRLKPCKQIVCVTNNIETQI